MSLPANRFPSMSNFERPELRTVDHPDHYQSGTIECIDAIEAQLTPEEFRGFLKGNVLKYMWRERMKGGKETLQKAQWYLNEMIDHET